MTVLTDKGKEFQIKLMWGPIGILNNELMIQYEDSRLISDISKDFEGCHRFSRKSQEEGDLEFIGYSVLKSVVRPVYDSDPDLVQLTFVKSKE